MTMPPKYPERPPREDDPAHQRALEQLDQEGTRVEHDAVVGRLLIAATSAMHAQLDAIEAPAVAAESADVAAARFWAAIEGAAAATGSISPILAREYAGDALARYWAARVYTHVLHERGRSIEEIRAAARTLVPKRTAGTPAQQLRAERRVPDASGREPGPEISREELLDRIERVAAALRAEDAPITLKAIAECIAVNAEVLGRWLRHYGLDAEGVVRVLRGDSVGS